jgi:5-methylcytosine-specific restriction endonuclease McrA
MSFGLSAPVLVLNRSFQPVRVTTAKVAFTMLYLGRARALDSGFEPHDFDAWVRVEPTPDDECIGTMRGQVRIPRVLLLAGYNRVPRAAVRLSRRNVFLRDAYTCQYCHRSPHHRDLNLDHVLPRSRGGKSSWENLVTSCRDCNLRKGGSTPEECGMLLRRAPVRPTWNAAVQLAAAPRRFQEWEPFLVTTSIPAGPPAMVPIDEVAEE